MLKRRLLIATFVFLSKIFKDKCNQLYLSCNIVGGLCLSIYLSLCLGKSLRIGKGFFMLRNITFMLLLSIALTGCSKSESVQNLVDFFAKIIRSESRVTKESKYTAEQQRLLDEISGIWRSDASELVSILIDGEQVIFLIDSEPLEARLGDVDTSNNIVNLTMREINTLEDVTWTIRKHIINDKGDFTLKVISHEGAAYDLSFVRNIGEIDRSRIMKIVDNYQPDMDSIDDQAYTLEEMYSDDASTAATEAYAVAAAEDQYAADIAAYEAAAAVEAAAAQATVVAERSDPKPQVKLKTEKLHLYADVQLNHGMYSLTTDRGFVVWQANVLNAGVAGSLRGLYSGQCFVLESKKGFNQTDGRDIAALYQVSC